MRSFSNKISISKNSRGVFSLDTIMGCPQGFSNLDLFGYNNGCYNECYAGKYSKIYGYDFSKAVKRDFLNDAHLNIIRKKLKSLEYIRIGTSGDPSHDWDHTFKVLYNICDYVKNIVIVTRHWNNIPSKYFDFIKEYSIIFNSSISVLDSEKLYNNCLKQYNVLSSITKSYLRVVSCEFNVYKRQGFILHNKQLRLLKNKNVIETVLRLSKNSHYIESGLIIAKNVFFLKNEVLVSIRNDKIYFGSCENCKQKCGVCYS